MPTEEEPILVFDLPDMPVYDGERARPLDPDCCALEHCPQREWNRSALLALENLTATYAALRLLEFWTAQVWPCDEEGHTVDCPNEGCQFSLDMISRLQGNRTRLEFFARGLYASLVRPATDLTAQWQGLFECEQAGEALDALAEAVLDQHDPEAVAQVGHRMEQALDVWRGEAVHNDLRRRNRWFSPAPLHGSRRGGRRGSPPA